MEELNKVWQASKRNPMIKAYKIIEWLIEYVEWWLKMNIKFKFPTYYMCRESERNEDKNGEE